MTTYLKDTEFLKKLSVNHQRNIRVKISSLTFDEIFIESIEGKATSGSITVDGKSSLRRTCSLTLLTNKVSLDYNIWGINTKFKLEIGVTNPFYNEPNNIYPEILWFPQGIYLITSFSQSIGPNNNTINISGKDKMVLLNGEVSGKFGQSTVLDIIEEPNGHGGYTRKKYDISKLIYDMLYLYGNEKNHNIIITDLEKQGLKMVKYIGNSNLYITQDIDPNTFTPKTGETAYSVSNTLPFFTHIFEEWNNNLLVKGEGGKIINYNRPVAYPGTKEEERIALSDIIFSDFANETGLENQTIFMNTNVTPFDYFLIYKLSYGDIAGYEATPMVYNDDLIAQPGETISSVLDKIVQMLGDTYEYFYNLEGQFIFQKKKIYTDTSWQPYSYYLEDGIAVIKQEDQEFIYTFDDNSLISSISLNPSVDKVKNDYIIYGETENGYPLHLRYAIDIKPTSYTPIRDNIETKVTYCTSLDIVKDNIDTPEVKIPDIESTGELQQDWLALSPKKQLIYKTKNSVYFSMSKHNYNNAVKNKNIKLKAGMFLQIGNKNKNYQVFRITKIEKTLLGRYRIYLDDSAKVLTTQTYDIYYQSTILTQSAQTTSVSQYSVRAQSTAPKLEKVVVDWRELIYQMAKDFHACGQEDNYTYKLRQANPTMLNGKTGYEQYYTDLMGFWPDLYRYKNEQGEEIVGWNQQRINDPNKMLYWLDFLEGDSSIQSLSIKNIGDRTHIKNEKKVSRLFEVPVPPILLYTDEIPQTNLTYSPCSVPQDLQTAFSLATFPKSAKTVMDNELSNYTFFAKSLNLTTVPLFYFDVNRKIKVIDLDNNIQGQFIINSLNFSLSYNGTMSISSSEVIEPLY